MSEKSLYSNLDIKVSILDTKTSKIRSFEDRLNNSDDPLFIWSDGNFSCDCNRADFFMRAGGEKINEDSPCGDRRFKIKIFKKSNNQEIYSEY